MLGNDSAKGHHYGDVIWLLHKAQLVQVTIIIPIQSEGCKIQKSILHFFKSSRVPGSEAVLNMEVWGGWVEISYIRLSL